MHFGYDGLNQRFVEFEIYPGIFKRAWIQYRKGPNDWANTGRYLNVVRVEGPHTGPAGQAADFPIYLSSTQMSDDQILNAFVYSVCAIVGNNSP